MVQFIWTEAQPASGLKKNDLIKAPVDKAPAAPVAFRTQAGLVSENVSAESLFRLEQDLRAFGQFFFHCSSDFGQQPG